MSLKFKDVESAKTLTQKIIQGAKDKNITAYKILIQLNEHNIGNFNKNLLGQYISPTFHYIYKNGLNKSDRLSKRITKKEIRGNRINEGFHCYLSLKQAKKALELTNIKKESHIFKVTIDPKRVVLTGKYRMVSLDNITYKIKNYYMNTIVCTQLNINLEKEIK